MAGGLLAMDTCVSRRCGASSPLGSGRSFLGATPVPAHALRTPALGPSRRKLRLDVCSAKGKRGKQMQQMQQQTPPVPPVDPDNAEFVLFIRAVKFPQWYPLSVVKGGTAANFLVRALDNELGRKLYGKTLVKNIGKVVYRDRKKIESMVKKQPMMKNFTEFEYGFKIRDKSDPKAWMFTDGVTLIPSESELGGTIIDNVKEWIDSTFNKS